MILFYTLVSSAGWQVLTASELAAYRVVTRAVNVNLMLIFMFAGSLELRTPASGADSPLLATARPCPPSDAHYSGALALVRLAVLRHQQG